MKICLGFPVRVVPFANESSLIQAMLPPLYKQDFTIPKMGDRAMRRTPASERKKIRRNSEGQISWDVISCLLVNVSRRCRGIFLPLSAGNYLPLDMLYSSTHTPENLNSVIMWHNPACPNKGS
jgi:hypothetical protein